MHLPTPAPPPPLEPPPKEPLLLEPALLEPTLLEPRLEPSPSDQLWYPGPPLPDHVLRLGIGVSCTS
jgi:hypothetical protein